MSLLSEFTLYGAWDTASNRWGNMLYNLPVSSGVDYFANNLKENKSAIMDKDAWGVQKQKVKMKIEENENALLEGNYFEPIIYGRAVWILKSKYHGEEGVQIVRIMSQLSSIDRASYTELEQGARNTEGIWD